MNIMIPKQHGAWSMLIIPFLFGVIAGNPKWEHILLFIGWLLLYLATHPFLMSLKRRRRSYYLRWFYLYFFLALLFILYPVITEYRLIYFGISMVPLFIINMYFSKIKKERALLNDIAAIVAFSLAGVTSYFYGTGTIDKVAAIIFIHSFLYFIGSTFYIKTMIREKKNIKYKYISWGYHLGLILALLVANALSYIIAYIPSVIRAFAFYGKKLPIKTIGIYEIINAVYYFIVMVIIFNN